MDNLVLVGNFRRSITVAELRRHEVPRRFLRKFCVFWKDDPNREIFKIRFRKDSSRHRSTCCVQFSWNLADGKSAKSCVTRVTKNSPGSPSLATARMAPKICRSQPQTMYSECSRFHSNRFTFAGVIAERVNIVETRPKVFPIFSWSLVLSRIKMSLTCW